VNRVAKPHPKVQLRSVFVQHISIEALVPTIRQYLQPDEAMRLALTCRAMLYDFGPSAVQEYVRFFQAVGVGSTVKDSSGHAYTVATSTWKKGEASHIITLKGVRDTQTYVRVERMLVGARVCVKVATPVGGVMFQTVDDVDNVVQFSRLTKPRPCFTYVLQSAIQHVKPREVFPAGNPLLKGGRFARATLTSIPEVKEKGEEMKKEMEEDTLA
jgi:hypothetical protein